MKTLELLRFEIGYQSRRWWTWAYVVATLVSSFEMAVQGYSESAQAGGYWFNAPLGIASMTLIGSAMGLLVAAAFSGDAGARDPETRMAPLVYTSPVQERSYLGGRFAAAFLLNALVLVTVQVALLAAVLVTDLPPEMLGPIRIATYLSSYALLALPNAFLATALLFSLSVLTRRAVASYLGAVVLFFTSIFVWIVVAEKLGQWELAKIIDPLGVTVIREVAQTTTAAQKNAFSIWSNSSLLLNRAVWLSVAAVIVAFTHLRFRFETAGARTWWRRASDSSANVEVEGGRSVPITVPKVERSSPTSVRLSQFAAITMQSFREVAISWGGLVLVVLTLILVVLGPRAMAHLGVPVIPTTEQMISWVGHPGEILWLIVPILTTFYAGELVWRDRETRLSEIADAAPVPEWVQVLGKFSGLALLLVVYQAMLMIACILIQVQMGYYDIELGLYARTVLGLTVIEHLLFAALAFALHVVINQKYAGYLVVIGVYALISVAPSLGIAHHLLVYGSSPEWTYSDMRGFGPSLIPWMWFKSYWGAWAVLFCVVATLFWVRGREPGFKARLTLVRERLTLRTLGIAAAMCALIVGTGGFIFYNTNVLNSHGSADERLAVWARYEKTYGKFAAMVQPELSAISLRADIVPEDRKATVHTRYTLVNRSSSPIRTIHFLPDDEVETSVPVFDRPARTVVDDRELHYRIHELATPLVPGDSFHVSFDVRFRPRGFANDGIDPSVVANGTYFEGNDWLPVIGYERAREPSGRVDRQTYGLPPRREVPSLDDTAARSATSAKRIAFDAVIATGEDQTAVAPGELRRAWVENGRRYFHYVADAPIRNDFAIYSARYSVRRETWNDVAIEVIHHPGHTTNVDRMIRSARASLDFFTKNFGPYPYRVLRLVEQPGQSMTLHASPINISYQEAFAGLNPEADSRKFDLAFAVVAHEIGHQWWGNQLSPADIEGGPILSESLAWYSAMCIVAASLGEDHLQRLLDMMHEGSWTISSRASVPLMRVYSRFAAYRKGPFAMYALREYVGERPVNDALRRLFDQYKTGEPPLPTTRELYAELKAVTPDSLQSLLADLFERNTYWELETKRVSAEPAGQGKWRVGLDVNARKVVVDTRGAETEVPMNDLVEIGVNGAGGDATRGAPLYRAMHRIKAGAQRISVLVAAQPVRAGIDPRNLLIDADPTDNQKEVSGPRIIPFGSTN
ncbi:MAG: ABC transporter permease [Gemmatimonadota bacterium]|nr:ABC transporter permease [Gemmatimonadota bacterium]